MILRLTYEAKDCVERTQKVGAKWTGENIAFDEKIEKIVFDYDGKRDRWNSYDATSYADVIYRYEAHDNQNKVSGQALEFKQTNMHALAQFYLHMAHTLKRKADELEYGGDALEERLTFNLLYLTSKCCNETSDLTLEPKG
ncbi:pre-mRNA-splicing factor SLU7-like protein [Tanacetum coccineum]